MNYQLPYIPERTKKKRESGLTMMMDKGLSLNEVKNFIEVSADYSDLAKIGFGTALIVKNLEEKIKLYKKANIQPYFGGTLFELFIARNKFEEYRKFINKYKLEVIEISDGSFEMFHEEKLKYIEIMSKEVTVLSEVGSKKKGVVIPPEKWIKMMKDELEAGSWKVIAEARESGTIGIYNSDGTPNAGLITDIIEHINPENVLWEAPNKPQQVYFIKLLGANVNLGNIATNEVFPLESLRLGLRGDTFFDFLPE
ncbi:MAG: phosphosulfolactate synthase [Bacteroidales bacterium]|nr:phosphosulfolactate synthase [Bacteroidales bacterium]